MCSLWVRWQGRRRTGEGKREEKSIVGKSSLCCDEVKPAFGSHTKIEKGPLREACGTGENGVEGWRRGACGKVICR